MPKTGQGKVRIQLDLEPEQKQELAKLAARLNFNQSEAAAYAFHNALQEEHPDPHRLARMETKLDEILEWL